MDCTLHSALITFHFSTPITEYNIPSLLSSNLLFPLPSYIQRSFIRTCNLFFPSLSGLDNCCISLPLSLFSTLSLSLTSRSGHAVSGQLLTRQQSTYALTVSNDAGSQLIPLPSLVSQLWISTAFYNHTPSIQLHISFFNSSLLIVCHICRFTHSFLLLYLPLCLCVIMAQTEISTLLIKKDVPSF